MEELIDIYDELDLPTGQVIEKNIAFKSGLIHRVSHLWLYKPGFVLLQKRAMTKRMFPGYWDLAVAGHVKSGEDLLDAAVRETKEELGMQVDKRKCRKIGVFNQCFTAENIKKHYFIHAYAMETNVNPATLKRQVEEVDKIKWFSLDEAIEIAKGINMVIPHGRHYFRYCLEWLAEQND